MALLCLRCWSACLHARMHVYPACMHCLTSMAIPEHDQLHRHHCVAHQRERDLAVQVGPACLALTAQVDCACGQLGWPVRWDGWCLEEGSVMLEASCPSPPHLTMLQLHHDITSAHPLYWTSLLWTSSAATQGHAPPLPPTPSRAPQSPRPCPVGPNGYCCFALHVPRGASHAIDPDRAHSM